MNRQAIRFKRSLGQCFKAPPRMDVDQWADTYRRFSKISNAKGGQWRSRCFQREIQREMTNRAVRSLVFIAAAQTGGKSELILNFIGRQIHLNPGPMLLVNPSTEFTERFSKKRLQPMINDTPVIRALAGAQVSRATKNTLRSKDFPGGNIFMGSANVPSDLASDPMRDVLIDEVDRCDKACGREGDIVTLAEARQESFGLEAFSLFTSTPSGTKPRAIGEHQPQNVSKIMLLFDDSDKRFWFCPCQKCGRSQTLKWSQVQWPENEPEKAVYVCENRECNYPHSDAERVAMIEQGGWKATAPFNGRRGYFLNGIYSLSPAQRGCVSKLHQMARTFLREKRRGAEALRAWVNTFLCECFQDEGTESVEPMPLFARREKFGEVLNPKICFITAGVDIHPDRIESQIVGWGDGEESWPLEYGIFLGDPKKESVWLELDRFILQQFDHPEGVKLSVDRACVDTGNSTDEAYNFCRDRALRGVQAVKGVKGFGLPVANPPKKSGVKKVRLWLVSKNTALRTLHARLKSAGGDGFIHFRSDREPMFGLEYFKQLTANEIITIKRAGIELQDFDAGGRRDEAMDTFVYALAAVRLRPPVFSKMLARIKEMAEAAKSGMSPNAKPPPRVFAGRGWNL